KSSTAPWLDPWLFFHAGQLYAKLREWKEADEAYREAIQRAETAGPQVQAQILRAWGKTFEQRSILAEAVKCYQQAVEKEDSATDDLSRAVDLDNLGDLDRSRGELSRAEDYYLQGLRIRERLAAGSLAFAASFNNLGGIAYERGDVSKAEEYYP